MKKTATKPAVRKAEPPAVVAEVPAILKDAYLLQENTLFPLAGEYPLSGATTERKFKSAAELEDIVFKNSKIIFGPNTIFINSHRKTGRGAKEKADLPPFLLDVTDKLLLRLYFVDIFLLKDDFYSTIFPRVTNLLTCFDNEENGKQVVELLKKNKEVQKLYEDRGEKEEYFFNSFYAQLGVILVTDKEMAEYATILNTYKEWRSVHPMVCTKYASSGHTLCTILPAFKPVYSNGKVQNTKEKKDKEIRVFTEEDHLGKVTPEIRVVYETIKRELLLVNSSLVFNPQKYYISVKNGKNIAVIHFSSKKITLVVMNPEADTRKKVKHHVIKTLTEKVQKFWNGDSCSIVIQDMSYIDEVLELLKGLVIE